MAVKYMVSGTFTFHFYLLITFISLTPSQWKDEVIDTSLTVCEIGRIQAR